MTTHPNSAPAATPSVSTSDRGAYLSGCTVWNCQPLRPTYFDALPRSVSMNPTLSDSAVAKANAV
ncbi:Uncharacterised protein [Mycobacteroides abscessus subsp. massiliense]|nr:Uncharacterised protein [Mycobacteroides abscessus subsp. massiliense]